MKSILTATLVAFGLAGPAAAQSIGGSYSVSGTNLDGSHYRGSAEITLTSKTTCIIAWKTGGTTASGICSRNGDTFAAAYEMSGAIGLVIYKVLPDGTLDGLWTIAGTEGNGTEVLTPE